jgi:hypothetical protein
VKIEYRILAVWAVAIGWRVERAEYAQDVGRTFLDTSRPSVLKLMHLLAGVGDVILGGCLSIRPWYPAIWWRNSSVAPQIVFSPHIDTLGAELAAASGKPQPF